MIYVFVYIIVQTIYDLLKYCFISNNVIYCYFYNYIWLMSRDKVENVLVNESFYLTFFLFTFDESYIQNNTEFDVLWYFLTLLI